MARGGAKWQAVAMRGLGLVLVGTLIAAGCDPPETADDDSPSAREDGRGKKRASAKRTALPLGKIRIDAPSEGDAGYRVDHDTVIQVLALIAMDAIPVTATNDGFRIDAAPPGSVIELAGLKKEDVVTHVNGVPVLEAEVLRKAHELFAIAQGVALTVRREDETLALNYRVYPARPRRPTLPRASSDPAPSRDVPAEVKSGVRETSEGHYEVSRKALDAILGDQALLMRTFRVIPAIEDGKPVGLKLYGIRKDSVPGVFGFKNGDRLEEVNGFALATPEGGLEAYESLRGQPKTVVLLTRRGKALRFEYKLVDP